MNGKTCVFVAIMLFCVANPYAATKPNLIFVFADEWRAQATGYAGDPNLQGKTPNLDRLATEGVNFCNAVSTLPVCSPYRGSMLTGRYPLSTGLFMNDKKLSPDEISIGDVYKAAGYATAYIGKWHVDGYGRTKYIPPERRQGFDYWKVLECTHAYNKSAYYDQDSKERSYWDGYDAFAQTKDAQAYIKKAAVEGKPFVFFLSWGPPHPPMGGAPEEFKKVFPMDKIKLRPNVPEDGEKAARKDLNGYYGHIIALDRCMGDLLKTIDEAGIKENTILVFTSDHGDMIESHGQTDKQRPWDESANVPLLIRYPAGQKISGKVTTPIGTPDLMPTLLGLSGLKIPSTVEGDDLSSIIRGDKPPEDHAVLIESVVPSSNWISDPLGREYRGIKTDRYTYVRDLKGPWLFFDNLTDPYQQKNLVGNPEYAPQQTKLDAQLSQLLVKHNDKFLPAADYCKQWGYDAPDKAKYVEKKSKNKKGGSGD